MRLLGVEPEVVTGDQEAEFSFTGATGELRGRGGLAPPYLVVDIGGGSTEFVLGTTDVEAARSVDIGCVRMTERHLHADPPDALSRSPPPAPTSTRRSTSAAETVPLDAGAHPGRPGRLGHHVAAHRAGPAGRTTRRASTTPGSRRPTCTARRATAARDAPRRAGRAALSCTRAGST